jgi:hypothetical protein
MTPNNAPAWGSSAQDFNQPPQPPTPFNSGKLWDSQGVRQVPFDSSNQWSNPANAANSAPAWNNPAAASSAQWNTVPQADFSTPSAPTWGNTGNLSGEQPAQDFSKALVPVSNQVPISSQPRDVSFPIIQGSRLEQLVPALPEDSVYVPPMYTKPRPLIPRYRIISGLLSVIIVALLACGGASYYAKASGTLGKITQAFTGHATQITTQSTTTQPLPDPKMKPDYGPALAQIPSATLAAKVDNNLTPIQPAQTFALKQPIYLTYNIPPGEYGLVTAKWYMNGNFFRSTPQNIQKDPKNPAQTTNGVMTMGYDTQAEGFVELYWNSKLAQRLYFVVRAQ